MDDNQFLLWGRRMATGLYDPPSNAPLFQSWVPHEGALRGQIVVSVRVRATDEKHARAKGRKRIEEIVKLLRYSQLFFGFTDGTCCEVGLYSEQLWRDHSIVVRLDERAFGTSKSGAEPGGIPFSASRGVPAWNGLEQILRLELSARNELQLRLTTALAWIGEAAAAPSVPISLVALTTALEALLIQKHERGHKRTRLMSRASKLIGGSEAEQRAVAQQIEELYETRNRCVHAGLIDVEKDEISAAIQLIGKTIAALVDRAPFCSMKSLNDVLRELDPALDIPRREWIAINAYYRWLGQGCPLGTDVQNWLDAEKEYMNTSI